MQDKHYYWWRAISATFFLRPNAPTLELLSKYRTLPIGTKKHHTQSRDVSHSRDELDKNITISDGTSSWNGNGNQNRKCIAMYVRRGAKAAEMALKPFKDYANAAVLLHERGYLNTKKSQALNNTSHTISLPVSATPPNDQRKPLIFIGTEDPSVLKEAIKWGKKNDWQVS
jgi:hypothetical protein